MVKGGRLMTAMTVPPYPRSSPLRLLLLLEWMLLGMVVIGQLVIAWARPGMTAPISNALGLVLFLRRTLTGRLIVAVTLDREAAMRQAQRLAQPGSRAPRCQA